MELQNLNENYWREVFQKYDTDGNGQLSLDEIKVLTESTEHGRGICTDHVKWTFRKADRDGDGQLDLDEFIRMVHYPNNDYTFKGLLRGYKRYVKLVVPKRVFADNGSYDNEYSCRPLPVILVIVSLLQIVFYVADELLKVDSELFGPIGDCLVYNPRKRVQIWRYVTYMFTHLSPLRLIKNLLVQIPVGAALEMVYGGRRVLAVYLAGVVATSLCISVLDLNIHLTGASSGMNSVITAHIATIIVNRGVMKIPVVQLLIFTLIFLSDGGPFIYILHSYLSIGCYYEALAFLLVGFLVSSTITTAVLWNRGLQTLTYTNYYPETNKN